MFVKYRMYVDETGNPDLRSSIDPNHRYLSLTGVIMDLTYVRTVVFPKVEELKTKYFDSHPDEPLILHRRELRDKKPPFKALKNPEVLQMFNKDLLNLLWTLEYAVLTCVIDKKEHSEKYNVWRYDPYHYSLAVLVERYAKWLENKNALGDVMAESRSKREDIRLKDSYERIYQSGTNFVPAEVFETRLTSRQLKVKPKSMNISGLQLADLIAHPSYRAILANHDGIPMRQTFGRLIAEILEKKKYIRSPTGKITGWGTKWLP